MSRATVVVVNWNGAHLLPACLDAHAKQTVDDAAVWVVDNASSDGSLELLGRDYPWVRVLANSDNRGFAGGNNTALREVTTPYAVLLNNDATPEPDWLERLLAPFDGDGRLAAVTSKVLLEPRFLRLPLGTAGFTPGAGDTRALGVRIASVEVGGVDVTERIPWEKLAYGAEGSGPGRFRWTRPDGELLVPVTGAGPHRVVLRWAAEAGKPVRLGPADLAVTADWGSAVLDLPTGTPTVDVVNNVGSVVNTGGHGGDRGYQEVDEGQYDEPAEVFALCGCAVAIRTEAGRAAGWFDEDFFLYYEDTDLSWRLRAAGWTIRYEPTAVVRHLHSATSVEWSPTFVFHVTRNRLLMLVKDATAARARHEWRAFAVDTLLLLRLVVGQLRRGRRPDLARLRARLRVVASLLRLTPAALRGRRSLSRAAVVPRAELERWLVSPR